MTQQMTLDHTSMILLGIMGAVGLVALISLYFVAEKPGCGMFILKVIGMGILVGLIQRVLGPSLTGWIGLLVNTAVNLTLLIVVIGLKPQRAIIFELSVAALFWGLIALAVSPKDESLLVKALREGAPWMSGPRFTDEERKAALSGKPLPTPSKPTAEIPAKLPPSSSKPKTPATGTFSITEEEESGPDKNVATAEQTVTGVTPGPVIFKETADANGWTPLMYAASSGNSAEAKTLLAKGANANVKSPDGWTPLLLASFEGSMECVNDLIAKGADVNAQTLKQTTALMCASGKGHVAVVHVLLNKKAAVNTKDSDGKTALAYAKEKEHPEIVEILQKAGATE